MDNLTVNFAGIDIGIETAYDFMRKFCYEYLSDEKPDFTVKADDADVKKQMQLSEEPTTIEYAEALQLYREIAERLPLYDRTVFHGAAVEYKGKAYIFTGESGAGKSTHISLLREFVGPDLRIINGDKPILYLSGDEILVYGTPHAGKEGWQKNRFAKLGGICFLSQNKENSIGQISPASAFTKLYRQTYKPKKEEAVQKTMGILRVLSSVPCYALSCNISEEAARLSFKTLTGLNFLEEAK